MIKRIASVILVLGIVLSFAVMNVSALPGDLSVIDSKSEIFDFENMTSVPANISMKNGGSAAISTEKYHGGQQSLVFNTAGSNAYIKTWITPNITLEANSKYYLSFWYYSDTWAGALSGTSAAVLKATFSSTAKSQWNKVWMTVDTASDAGCVTGGLAIAFWSVGNGNKLYIDDLEIAKVESFSGKENEIPTGLAVSASATQGFEKMQATGFTSIGGTSQGASLENPHWGEASFSFIGDGAENEAKSYYINASSAFGEGLAIAADTTYYMSYYVYSPERAISVRTDLINGREIVNETEIPQATWTKVSGLFKVTADEAALNNQQLLRVYAINSQSDTVYFDDFVFAKLSGDVADTALTQSGISCDSELGTATVTFTSDIAVTSLEVSNITAPEGITVTNATLSGDGLTATVELSGVVLGESYELTFTDICDTFGRVSTFTSEAVMPPAYEQTEVTETTTADGNEATYTKSVTKHTAGEINVAFIVAAYNEEGEMIDIGMDINPVSNTQGAVAFSVTIDKGVTYKVSTAEWPNLAYLE